MNNKCIICKHKLEKIITFSNMPNGAQMMPNKEELSLDKGDNLTLKRCPYCGLVQFDCEPVTYYKKVIRAVGLSSTMKKLRKDDYNLLINKYHMNNKKWFECGTGDGSFLEILKEYPVEIYGCEYDEHNVAEAQKKLNTKNIIRFFPNSENDTIAQGPFDVFLSFNFLEHQIEPLVMLKFLYNNLKDDGIGLITVPSFEYIYNQGYYYEFVKDHVAYYDLNSLTNLCHLANFEVIQHDYIGIKDTLRIIVKKSKKKLSVVQNNEEYKDDKFMKNYNRVVLNINKIIKKIENNNKTLAVWGASHQSFTLLSSTPLFNRVEYIIDSAPFKQGLFSPVSHLPIVSQEYYTKHPVDCVLITAPGYIDEISKLINQLSDKPTTIYNILDLNK